MIIRFRSRRERNRKRFWIGILILLVCVSIGSLAAGYYYVQREKNKEHRGILILKTMEAENTYKRQEGAWIQKGNPKATYEENDYEKQEGEQI